MPKLTLTFRGKILQVVPVDRDCISIGRDEENEMRIDSLAVAPRQAAVVAGEKGWILRHLDSHFPLRINDRAVAKEQELQNGDRISLGKHEVIFFDDEPQEKNWSEPNTELAPEKPQDEVYAQPQDAGLQMLNGKRIGWVKPLRNPMTRLDEVEGGALFITRNPEGFFLSIASHAPEQTLDLKVNRQPVLSARQLLKHGDIIEINGQKMQFFLS